MVITTNIRFARVLFNVYYAIILYLLFTGKLFHLSTFWYKYFIIIFIFNVIFNLVEPIYFITKKNRQEYLALLNECQPVKTQWE